MGGGPVAVLDEGRGSQYNGRTTVYVVFVAVVAGCGGLLFGYDNGITGGVIAQYDFQRRFFPETLETHGSTNAYCEYNDHVLQLFTSSLFIAGAFAALVGMVTCKRYGRKITMLMGGACFLVGTVLVATAYNIGQLVVGRVVLGVGVGFATQATPLYLSEMAPYNLRGAMNIGFQLAVTIGILAAQLINYGAQYIQPWGWRLSLGLGGIPALIMLFGSMILPDTPNSLVQRGRYEQGLKVLRRVRGVEDVSTEMQDIQEAVREAQLIPNPYRSILKRRYRPQLVISIVIPIIQQFTGINAIMFYAPQLFASIGSSNDAALLNTVIIGAVNVGSTIIAICVVDKFGRRVLFMESGVQMFIAEVIVGFLILAGMGNDGTGTLSKPLASATIAFICIYVSGFAWSWGPLGWLVPSEIQPLETRAAGTAVNTFTNLMATFIIGQCFLSMLCSMRFGVFFFFAGFVLIGTLFAYFFIPETKNVPIEEMEEVRIGRHWFWKRIVAGTRPSVIATVEPVAAANGKGAPSPMPLSKPYHGNGRADLSSYPAGPATPSSGGFETGNNGHVVVNNGHHNATQMTAFPR